MSQLTDSHVSAMVDITREAYNTQDGILYVFAFIFLKYLNDNHENSLYPSTLKYALPSSALWETLLDDSSGQILIQAINDIENSGENEYLHGILPLLKLDTLLHTPTIYRKLLESVSEINLKEVPGSRISSTFEGILEDIVMSQGRYVGDFYTPDSVSFLLASLLGTNRTGTIYDPTCGTASLLLKASSLSTNRDIFGQERNPQIAAIAKINLFLHGISPLSIAVGDTLLNPVFINGNEIQRFDYIISNIPIGLRIENKNVLLNDQYSRFQFGIPSRNLDFAFIQHVVSSLSENGRAILLVMPSLLSYSGSDGNIRKNIIESDIIEAVISLSSIKIPSTNISPIILIINKMKPLLLKNNIIFINKYNKNDTGEDKDDIIDIINNMKEIPRKSSIISVDKVRDEDYILNPVIYINLFENSYFLGGSVEWVKLKNIAKINKGLIRSSAKYNQATISIITHRNIHNININIDNLDKVNVDNTENNHIITDVYDILIAGHGDGIRMYLIEENMKGLLVGSSLYIIRLEKEYIFFARYIVEFFNSDIGQHRLNKIIRNQSISIIPFNKLQDLIIPIPSKSIARIVDDLHKIEVKFIERIDKTKLLKQRLFNISDSEKVDIELQDLTNEAHILASSITQSDDLDFQIHNFYPFPLAFVYRILSIHSVPMMLYKDQLRLAENILAFLVSVGFAFIAHIGVPQNDCQSFLTTIKDSFKKGVSPGHWLTLSQKIAQSLRENKEYEIIQQFSQLWFNDSAKESNFVKDLRKLVELKNDFKHDRGPITRDEYDRASGEMISHIRTIMKQISLFMRNPLRLVDHIDNDWKTKEALINTFLYMGDHQGLRQELISLSSSGGISLNKLYLQTANNELISLYPFLSVNVCRSCNMQETYMIDRWEGFGKEVKLKSFERGHTTIDQSVARTITSDFEHWLKTHLVKDGSIM